MSNGHEFDEPTICQIRVSWAVRNQHFYEKMGFVKVRETEVDPNLGWAGVEYEKRT